jgi:metal-responsive CopG/Arc/MetJ family transcriptional regulator
MRRPPRGSAVGRRLALAGYTSRLNLYLTPTMRARIDRMAGEQGIKPSELVRIAVRDYLERTLAARGVAYTAGYIDSDKVPR